MLKMSRSRLLVAAVWQGSTQETVPQGTFVKCLHQLEIFVADLFPGQPIGRGVVNAISAEGHLTPGIGAGKAIYCIICLIPFNLNTKPSMNNINI